MMKTFKIRGTVKEAETGAGAAGLFVKAYDNDLLFDDLLGSAYTGEDGGFEIVSEAEDFRDFYEVRPDIYLKVFSTDGETLLHTTETAAEWRDEGLEDFEVRIPAKRLNAVGRGRKPPAGKGRSITLNRLAKKGLRISVPVLDDQAWRKVVKADPAVPRSFAQLRRLGRTLFKKEGRKSYRPESHARGQYERQEVGGVALLTSMRGIIYPRVEECGESAYARFFTGLGNPALTPRQRDIIEADMDADTPTFENSTETEHFILRWTNSSAHAADNIADPAIIDETGGFLETAWGIYNSVFGRAPYVPAGGTKIEVIFHDISGFGVASPPDSPIQFDAASWVTLPGIRRPTSAHELFHKLQYAFGYRTTWTPVAPFQWFSEGTASWSEVYVWQRVSGAYKITDLFASPDLNLYNASYSALPFWIFFQTRQQDAADDNPFISFLQKYDATGDEKAALAEVIDEDWPSNNVYGQLDTFFALFSRERRLGAWRQTPTGGQPYATILGPDDANIVPALAVTGVPLGAGDSYHNTGAVSPIGTDYYRFSFEGDTDGLVFNVSVAGAPGGDYSYYLIWEKAGVFKSAAFPFGTTGDYSFSETIDLAAADSLMLLISGRGAGGSYSIDASVA